MAKFKNAGEARRYGMLYAVHVLNQPDAQDNGWNYFPSREEATEWAKSHPDTLNSPTIDKL